MFGMYGLLSAIGISTIAKVLVGTVILGGLVFAGAYGVRVSKQIKQESYLKKEKKESYKTIKENKLKKQMEQNDCWKRTDKSCV